MRKLLIAAVLFSVVSGAFAANGGERALVAVNHPDPGTTATLLDSDVMVVRDMERYLLAAVTPEELARLNDTGVVWRVLDESMTGKTYYTVTLGRESRLAELEFLVRVLRADAFDAVVEASPGEIEKVMTAGFEVARVFVRPIRLSKTAAPARAGKTMVADPQIQAMVNAVSITNYNSYVQRLQDFVTRQANTDSCQAAANWIKATYESFGIDSVMFHNFSSTYKDNVVATIPGVGDPSKIILIGGHYDSYTGTTNNAPGADDDATGTACALECARILSQYEWNYTLVFMAFGGEEYGLYGSEGYASDAAARGDDIVAAVCVDMIGYVAGGDAIDLDIISNTGSQWIRAAVDVAATDYVPALSVVTGSLPGGASSDHASFWAHGYDAILFFEDTGNYSPYIHTTNDVVGVSYNNPTLAERSVKAAVALLATLAEPFQIAIIHDPLADTEDTSNDYRVAAEIVSAEALEPDSLLVHWSNGGGWNEIAMTATGNPDEYEAFIPAQPGGTWVEYYISAGDIIGNRATDPKDAPLSTHTFFVGVITTTWFDDFEANLGWTVGDAGDDATTGVWERCNPQATDAQPEDDHTPAPGVNAYITQCAAGTSIGSYDVDGGKTTLISPNIDLSGETNAYLRYWLWYVNDAGSAPGTDYWYVRASDDGGQTWVTLDSTYSSTRPWTLAQHDLSQYIALTNQVRFKFVASDEGDGSIVEAGVDDVAIVSYQSGISTGIGENGPAASARVVLGPNVPNPFNPVTDIRFAVPAPGRKVTLKIYDLSGREVRTLVDAEKLSGERNVTWNGTDNAGHDVASGVYFYRLEAGGEKLAKKLLLVR
ncbi:MAG: M28 family peptidase [Candidatus Eisenbacteria bacterium]